MFVDSLSWGVIVLVLLGVLLLVGGLVGLVLLIVGIAKRKTAVWVIGLVCLVPVVLAALLAVPALVFLGIAIPARMATPMVMEAPEALMPMEESGEGDFVRMGNGRATARAAGVDIEVLRPGSGSSGSSTSTHHGLGGLKEEHRIHLGDVTVDIRNENGRLDLSVNSRDCGRVSPGDQVVVTEDRQVFVNGMPR